MIPKEILKKVRHIEITTSRMVSDVFAGHYHSIFKGQGMEFDEVREYQLGDDIRSIDWNVTARTGVPHIKKYVEEREMTVMLLVDMSMSCRFGSQDQLKSAVAAEIAAILAFSAIRNNDKVGLVVFTNQIEKFIPPRKGLRHVLRVIREVLYFKPQGKGTDVCVALDYLSKITTHKSVAFLLSDFLDPLGADKSWDQAYPTLKKTLSVANRRHDLIAVSLNDPLEQTWPACGVLRLKDAESGRFVTLDAKDARVRRHVEDQFARRRQQQKELFGSVGIDCISLETDKPYTQELVKFFKKRQKRLSKI
jgi:uncharacterized protein (DUF58 family)